jgi:hypothetical protein
MHCCCKGDCYDERGGAHANGDWEGCFHRFHDHGATDEIGWVLLGVGLARGPLPKSSAQLVPRLGAVAITAFAVYLVIAPFLQGKA